ncbi:MAG: DUF1127 domain-containing protein [Pseudomonadota bacterium]
MRETNNLAGFGVLFTTGATLVSPVHEWVTREPLYRLVEPPDRRSPVVRLIARLTDGLERLRQRQEQRRSLAMLDDHLLRDIGLTREDVSEELRTSFWR